jgi:hypothetical protein
MVLQVVACLVGVIQAALYDSLSKEEIQDLFAEDFHPALKGLLADIVTAQMAGWREASIKSMVCTTIEVNSMVNRCKLTQADINRRESIV